DLAKTEQKLDPSRPVSQASTALDSRPQSAARASSGTDSRPQSARPRHLPVSRPSSAVPGQPGQPGQPRSVRPQSARPSSAVLPRTTASRPQSSGETLEQFGVRSVRPLSARPASHGGDPLSGGDFRLPELDVLLDLELEVAEINGQPLEDEQPLESTASARRLQRSSKASGDSEASEFIYQGQPLLPLPD
ncbi:unnamed protein product, partial [Cladocopium goreaui]